MERISKSLNFDTPHPLCYMICILRIDFEFEKAIKSRDRVETDGWTGQIDTDRQDKQTDGTNRQMGQTEGTDIEGQDTERQTGGTDRHD